jgi:hypothetical protein
MLAKSHTLSLLSMKAVPVQVDVSAVSMRNTVLDAPPALEF